MNQRNPRLFALLLTLGFFSLLGLYVREFPVLANTMSVIWLVAGSMVAGLLISGGVIWLIRPRFMPWNRHRVDVALVVVTSMVFAPLFGSLINRGLGSQAFESFEFVSETPFVAAGYGILQGEKLKPTGYHLVVKADGVNYKFKYKSQPYYPVTKPGEQILLPINNGFLGAKVMLLK